jgi:phospholipid/cholesterol/gamma-HCH transport system permease protein
MTSRQYAQLEIRTDTATVPASATMHCSGAWTVRDVAPAEKRLATLVSTEAGEWVIDVSAITALDTAGAWLLHRTVHTLEQRGVTVRIDGLRSEFSTLLKLVTAHAAIAEPALPSKVRVLTGIGLHAWHNLLNLTGMLAFIGESAVIFLRSLVQPRRIRWLPILHNLQTAGFEALPITGLLSFLMGVVIAYQGADQLQQFGANIFVVDLVGLAMLRELSPLLTAIIVAGRSGSAYAAQIGTMKISEEVDALRTIGVGPQELLVQPKILALIIALPLLTVFADIAGLLGGMVMASNMLDISFNVFIDRLELAISLSSFLTGVSKAPVFAVIIALVGCFQGFQASGSADSVGRQTTISVVQSIFLVIVADALFSIVFNWLDL